MQDLQIQGFNIGRMLNDYGWRCFCCVTKQIFCQMFTALVLDMPLQEEGL